LKDRLDAYLNGDLPREERLRFEQQLSESPELRVELAELRRLLDLLHAMPEELPPPFLADRVLGRIAAGEARPIRLLAWAERARHMLGTPWSVPVVAALAGLLVFALVQNVEVQIKLPFSTVAPGPESPLQAAPRTLTESALPQRTPVSARGTGSAVALAPEEAAGSSPAEAAEGPQRFACGGEEAGSPACGRWRSWMLGLALRDPTAFARELANVPPARRASSLLELSRLAGATGTSRDLAEQLRGSDDPRANSLAPHFDGPITPVSDER